MYRRLCLTVLSFLAVTGVSLLTMPAAARAQAPAGVKAAAIPEATSLLGVPLYTLQLAPDAKKAADEKIRLAREALAKAPASADAILWLGRQLAVAGQVREAVDVFTSGIAKFPNDARFYRHRGHRYVTLRQFDKAIADLTKASQLVAGKPDEQEPTTADAKVMSSETLDYGDLLPPRPGVLPEGRLRARAARLPAVPRGGEGADGQRRPDRRLERLALHDAPARGPHRRSREGARGDRPGDEGQGRPELLRPPDDVQGRAHAAGDHGRRRRTPCPRRRSPTASRTGISTTAGRPRRRAIFQRIVKEPNWMPFGVIAAEAELARMK